MKLAGYAGEILVVNLSEGKTTTLPTAAYADKFIGGRGVAARIYWEMVPPGAKAFDPENCFIAMTGPVTGFPGIAGGSRWQICSTSPIRQPETFSYANLGERWGSRLKLAGFDGLVVQGRAEKPCYLYIDNGRVEIRDASSLWGKPSFEAADTLKASLGSAASVLTIGPAAENLVSFATLITDDGASGASGLGSVMGSKKLKAIAVGGSRRPAAADPEKLRELARQIHQLRKDTWKGWHENIPGKTRPRPCYGCPGGCFRKAYQEGGRSYKFFCQAVHVYWAAAHEYAENGTDTALLAMRLCDHYGLDTSVMQPLINWLALCYREGLLGEEETGLPLSKIGSAEFIEKLTRMIALREGFGNLLAAGTLQAAEAIGPRAVELTGLEVSTPAGETRDYDPRLIPANALLYATEQRRPINQLHEMAHALWLWLKWWRKDEDGFAFLSYDDLVTVAENFWGGPAAADYTTYEGKALAAKKIQDRSYAKESLILCDFLWPVIWVRFADSHAGDPTLESRLYSAITGREIDEAGLNKMGERIFNLQRAIMLRQGWGGREGDRLLDFHHDEPLPPVFYNPDCLVPGKDGRVVSKKGNKVRREDFEKLKDEYYALRGWDAAGLPTEARLKELDLADVAADLEARRLLGRQH
jgi:aldehyde:ferredoxin oxidoreductase